MMFLLSHIQLLFTVSRPLSWTIAPSIWFSGLICSGASALTTEGLLFAVALSFPICLITFGVNDVYDYDSDTHNGRKVNKWVDGTALDPTNRRYVLQAARVSTVLVILLTSPATIGSTRLLGYTVSILCLIWTYSSPPFRLKERPILDSISNGIICWLFWACGSSFNGSTSLVPKIEQSSIHGRLVLLYASALHSMAAIVDTHADLAANYRTIATVCGEKFAAVFSLICFLSAGFTIDLRSDAGLAIFSGILASLTLVLAPRTKYFVVRIVFAGSYIGMIVWTLRKVVEIRKG